MGKHRSAQNAKGQGFWALLGSYSMANDRSKWTNNGASVLRGRDVDAMGRAMARKCPRRLDSEACEVFCQVGNAKAA